jgi:hypothetical protein
VPFTTLHTRKLVVLVGHGNGIEDAVLARNVYRI